MQKKISRESNYDLLRCLCMLMVIMIHVSATWRVAYRAPTDGVYDMSAYVVIDYIYNAVSRFSVPCFLMLSGAFLLDDEKTADYRDFYTRSFRKVGIPTLIFTAIYVMYSVVLCFISDGTGTDGLKELFLNVIYGLPYYHMWYLTMLVTVYLLAPIAIRFKDSITLKQFQIASVLFCIWAGISMNTSQQLLQWDLGMGVAHLSFFLLGYTLRKSLPKSTIKGSFFTGLGLLCAIAAGLLQYRNEMILHITDGYIYVKAFSPLIMLSSVLVFAGFTMLNVKEQKWISRLSGKTFLIFLIHALIWDEILLICGEETITAANPVYMVPLLTVIVFAVSWALTTFWICIKKRIRKSEQSAF